MCTILGFTFNLLRWQARVTAVACTVLGVIWTTLTNLLRGFSWIGTRVLLETVVLVESIVIHPKWHKSWDIHTAHTHTYCVLAMLFLYLKYQELFIFVLIYFLLHYILAVAPSHLPSSPTLFPFPFSPPLFLRKGEAPFLTTPVHQVYLPFQIDNTFLMFIFWKFELEIACQTLR